MNQSKLTDEWATPRDFVESLGVNFDVDLAATSENKITQLYLSKETDALNVNWRYLGKMLWCNPPYSNITPWVEKSIDLIKHKDNACVIMLLPASTDTKWFKLCAENSSIFLLPGRLKFTNPNYEKATVARFGSMVAVFNQNLKHSIQYGFEKLKHSLECVDKNIRSKI